MKKNIMSAIIVVAVFWGTTYSMEGAVKKKMLISKASISDIVVKIKSDNVRERMDAFGELVYVGDYETAPDCKFKVGNKSSMIKVVIDLVRRENKYESDNLTNGMYPPKLGEGYAYYLQDIKGFVDSCEDESAIDLLPGPRTRNKYSEQSIEYILSRFEKHGADSYGLGYLGELAPRYKQTNRKLYDKVKSRLIDLVDDEKVSDFSVYALKHLDDVDLIPVFEKISKYDNSKGRVVIDKGNKYIEPISGIATEALLKLKQKQHKFLQSSTTGYTAN